MEEMQETCVPALGREDPLEEEMATCSSILAWEIPQTEEPGRLQSMGLQSVEHDERLKVTTTTSTDKDVGELESSYIASGNENITGSLEKVGPFSKT